MTALTREQFASTYGLSSRTVDRLRKSGKLRWYRIGRKVRVMPLDEDKEADKKAK